MKRYLQVLLLLCSFSFNANAQRDDDEESPPMVVFDREGEPVDPEVGRLIIDAGLTNMRPWRLNQQLFGIHTFNQFTTIGFAFGFADETNEESEDFIVGTDITYGFHGFLMQEKRGIAANGDIMNYKLKGWEIMTSSIALNVIRSEYVDFVCGVGIFWGNWKLYSDNLTQNTGDRLYKNPFVAPMFRSELRFNLWRFTLGARFSYRHDITKDDWRAKDDGLESLPGYQMREMQFMVYLGLREINP